MRDQNEIRPGYAGLPDWSMAEYEDFWKNEKKMEEIIKSGNFGRVLKDGFHNSVDNILREVYVESVIKKARRKWWKRLFNIS